MYPEGRRVEGGRWDIGRTTAVFYCISVEQLNHFSLNENEPVLPFKQRILNYYYFPTF